MSYPTGGQVRINGIPTTNLNTKLLRKRIASLSYHDHLIFGSVMENIQMGRSFDTAQIISLAESIGLVPYVLNLKDAYQTVLNPEAGTLDRQLVTLVLLCRALLDQPAVLLWDLQTHYLSDTNLKLVMAYFKDHYKGTIILASAQLKSPAAQLENLRIC